MEQPLKDLTGYVVNKYVWIAYRQYKLVKKLGAGAFGEIYAANYAGEDYAIKIERADSKHPQL